MVVVPKPLTNHSIDSCRVGRGVESSALRHWLVIGSSPPPGPALCPAPASVGGGISISTAIFSDAMSVDGGRVHPSLPLKSRIGDFQIAIANFLSVSGVLGSESRFKERTCVAKLRNN